MLFREEETKVKTGSSSIEPEKWDTHDKERIITSQHNSIYEKYLQQAKL